MSPGFENVKVPVTLTYHQTKAAKSALNILIVKLRRENENRPFTPEPGHLNITEAKIKTAKEAYDALEAALVEALESCQLEPIDIADINLGVR